MDVIENNGNFEGTATDDESRELFKEEVISVKGFFADGIISFFKRYPYSYFGTSYNTHQVDYSKKNHVVEYVGSWNEEEHKFVGTYSVLDNKYELEDLTGLYNEPIYEGNWEMMFEK